MASQAKENMQVDELTVVADRGYYSTKQFELCENANIKPIVTEANQRHHAASPEYEKDQFVFDEENNVYTCPQGSILTPYKNGLIFTNRKACRECEVREKCTSGKYRVLHDRPQEKYARIVDKRTAENIELYRKRQQTVTVQIGNGAAACLQQNDGVAQRTADMRAMEHFVKC